MGTYVVESLPSALFANMSPLEMRLNKPLFVGLLYSYEIL